MYAYVINNTVRELIPDYDEAFCDLTSIIIKMQKDGKIRNK